MKKITALFTALALIVGLCACSAKVEEPTWQEQYDIGIRYLSEGNYQEAIIAFEAAITIEPGNLDSYMCAAEAYLSSGDEAAAANVLVRGYIATGDEDPLWKLISEVNSPDILGDGYWSYWIEGVPAVCYECGEDPDSQALRDKYHDGSGSYAVGASGCLTLFEEPLPIEICGEHLTIEQANSNFLSDTLESEASDQDENGRQVILSGYISFNKELYRMSQIFGGEVVEESDGKYVLIWSDEKYKNIDHTPGGLWSLIIEDIESLP